MTLFRTTGCGSVRLKSAPEIFRSYQKTDKVDCDFGKRVKIAKLGEQRMMDSQTLLNRISALRRHLEQVQGPAHTETTASPSPDTSRLGRLEQQVAEGIQEIGLLSTAIRQLSPATPLIDGAVLPRQLTSRARRILERGQQLLDRLRRLGADFDSPAHVGGTEIPERVSHSLDSDPFMDRYTETAAMVEIALRVVQAFPDAPSGQLRLCEGIEAILGVVADRIEMLEWAAAERRREDAQVTALADVLNGLHSGAAVKLDSVTEIATAIIDDARSGGPLRFLRASPELTERFVAAHSLTTARVAARIGRHDPDHRKDPTRSVLAALLHDVGMLRVPAEILARPGALDDAQRRIVESHPQIGAEILTRWLPSEEWLAEAAAGHHERLDGTGYPAGLRENQLSALTRFIMVCDVYAALVAARPHRPGFDTRTALADTLLSAEKGLLDRDHAERLLQLSFYPVGSVVELADGAVGVVVATHMGRRDLNTPARPVLALLTDSEGQALAGPHFLDLAQCDGQSILRALKPPERRKLLGKRYPEFV
jgi:HD-GYP domain-containing protein (c-di-GMP phosphodiesterase class II)